MRRLSRRTLEPPRQVEGSIAEQTGRKCLHQWHLHIEDGYAGKQGPERPARRNLVPGVPHRKYHPQPTVASLDGTLLVTGSPSAVARHDKS